MKLDLRLDEDALAPGRALSGHVLVLEDGGARSLTLTVRFCERSPGYLETSVSLREGDLAAGQAVGFRHDLPDSALPSPKGEHGKLFSDVEARVDRPGLDVHAGRAFEVTSTVRRTPTSPAGSVVGKRLLYFLAVQTRDAPGAVRRELDLEVARFRRSIRKPSLGERAE